MIPTSNATAVPAGHGNILFHVVVDDLNQVFCMENPDETNGIRLHYEMQRYARAKRVKLRDFDLRAESKEEAVSRIKTHFPDYEYLGGRLSVWAQAN